MLKDPNQNPGRNLLHLYRVRHLSTAGQVQQSFECAHIQGKAMHSLQSRNESAESFPQALKGCEMYQSHRGSPKRPATESAPAGVLNPSFITAAAHQGALLKHPVFHAAPPHCTCNTSVHYFYKGGNP